MNYVQDTFESVHRRKRLAAWLATLKGPSREPKARYPNAANTMNYGDLGNALKSDPYAQNQGLVLSSFLGSNNAQMLFSMPSQLWDGRR